ncbi:hypothetical protein JTB14_020516 [Gonioctena quinquepunctata]|nr:hypothetical protein JTB14_020516 [Gonioctena quinquepunctata]
MDRKWGDVNFYFTQVLTGHGCFQAYPYRFKVRGIAEHTIFECVRWEDRKNAEVTTGRLLPENMVGKMLENKENMKAVSKCVKIIMTTNRKEMENPSEQERNN